MLSRLCSLCSLLSSRFILEVYSFPSLYVLSLERFEKLPLWLFLFCLTSLYWVYDCCNASACFFVLLCCSLHVVNLSLFLTARELLALPLLVRELLLLSFCF